MPSTGARTRELVRSGRELHDAGSFEAAGKLFEQAVALEPCAIDAQLWLGNALAKQAMAAGLASRVRLGTRARDAWLEVVRLDPRNVQAHENLFGYYSVVPSLLGGSLTKAAEHATMVRLVDVYRGEVMLARVSEQRRDTAAAVQHFAAAAQTAGDSTGSALFGWLLSLHGLGRYADAFTVIDARLRKAPNDVVALAFLARSATRSQQRVDDGLSAAERARRLPVPAGYAFGPAALPYWRGRLLEMKGDRRGAESSFRESFALDTTDRTVLDDIKRVTARP